MPWTVRVWGLPFHTVLSPSERYYQRRRRSPRTLLDRARQAVWLVRRWLPERELVIVGDHIYAALEWLDVARHAVCVIPACDSTQHSMSRPRHVNPGGMDGPARRGKRLPTLEKVSTDSTTVWTTVNVVNWYGAETRHVQVTSNTAVWYHSGKPVVPIRRVVIRDHEGHFAPQTLLATNPSVAPAQILTYFVRRWQLETTCEGARAHLDVETRRQWSHQATAQTTPALLALYSIVTLMAAYLAGTNAIPVRMAAWYDKAHATFSDTIALVRCWVWRECHWAKLMW